MNINGLPCEHCVKKTDRCILTCANACVHASVRRCLRLCEPLTDIVYSVTVCNPCENNLHI